MKDRKINKCVVLINGFIVFGLEQDAPEGFVRLKYPCVSGGWSHSRGVPGICSGDGITLNPHESDNAELITPISSVVFMMDCVDLYNHENTKLNLK